MVSIIIPVYNAKHYLDKCLQSIEKQIETDWECLIVDDGSNDGSVDICKTWERRDLRFKVLSQENCGVSVARNIALHMAEGDWITFVDADDWLDENFLSEMLSVADGCDIVLSGQIREFANYKQVYKPSENLVWPLNVEHALEFNSLNEKFLFYAPHEKLFRKDLIIQNNLYFEPKCSYGEDLQFVYSYLEHVQTIATINKAMYHYRMANEGTLSTVFRENQFDEDYKQWKIVYNFYKCHKLLTKQAMCYLYRRLWGIVYDGLFLTPRVSKGSWSYISSILSIPEIVELRNLRNVFVCSAWIKFAILNKLRIVFFCYFKIFK